MPSLGADMRDGTLTEWLVAEGDKIQKGDIIAVIESSKGAIDMESYHSGTIAKLLVQPVISLPVGAILGKLEVDSDILVPESQPLQPPQPLTEASPGPSSRQPPQSAQPKSYTVTNKGVLASPVVRQIARQRQLDLAGIQGSGPDGAILLKDIERLEKTPPSIPEQAKTVAPTATTAPSTAPTTGERNLQAIRDAIAAAMEKSKREIPHYYLSLDIDLSRAQQWLSDENAGREPEDRLLLLALLLKAVANILPKFPALNGHLRSSELTDATITVTSIGDRGSDSVFGVIYPPQVAIIGFGRVRQSPQVKNGRVEICDMVTVSLSADHRISDGTLGAKFLNALSLQLQQPELL